MTALRKASNRYVSTPTTHEERAMLRAAGFVHVSGLVPTSLSGKAERAIGSEVTPDMLGTYGSNNGTSVIYTPGGEVWLAFHTQDSMANMRFHEIPAVLQHFCNKDPGGVWVPCSNSESLSWRDVMKRVADPDYEPR